MKTVTLLALVACSTAAVAQDFPNPKPTDAHAVLAKEAGTWDCDVKMFLAGPTGEPTSFKGVERNRVVNGGLHVTTTFEMDLGERSFTGHGITGWDARAKQYVGTWADNFTAAPIATKGTYDPETKTMTVDSTVVDEEGNEMHQKQVTTWTGEDTKTFTISLVVEAGGQKVDVKLMEMTAKRRAARKNE